MEEMRLRKLYFMKTDKKANTKNGKKLTEFNGSKYFSNCEEN